MKIIGDAGGTSTHWRILHRDGKIDQLKTRGLNLMHHHPDDYLKAIKQEFATDENPDEVHFYVAGFFSKTQAADLLRQSLEAFFQTQKIEIQNDLMAAARALCGHQQGWIGILGTGANVARYDGLEIKNQIPPLGYLLGDEGSGAYLGKRFFTNLLRGRIPDQLEDTFYDRFKLDHKELLASVYDKNDPKLFLSSIAPFLNEFKNVPEIYQLVYSSFSEHMDVFLAEKHDEHPVHYTGSIAFNFNDILRQVASDKGIMLGQITMDPIAGLALYHQYE